MKNLQKILLVFIMQLIVFVPLVSAKQTLSELIPSTNKIPYLNEFISDNTPVQITDDKIEITGNIKGISFTITKNKTKDKTFSVKVNGEAIGIGDLVGITNNRILNKFKFKYFSYTNKKLTITSIVNNKDFTIIQDINAKNLSATASNISIIDILGLTSHTLNNVKLKGLDLDYTKDAEKLTLNGSLNDVNLTIEEDTVKKIFTATVEKGKALYLKDIIVTDIDAINNTIDKKIFNNIGFSEFDIDAINKTIKLGGKANNETISIEEDITNKKFIITSSGMSIGDILGITSHTLNNVKLKGLDLDYTKDAEKLTLNGSLNDVNLTIEEDTVKKIFTATVEKGKALYLKDIIVTDIDAINNIVSKDILNGSGFGGFSINIKDKIITLNGKMHGKDFFIEEDITNKKFIVKASDIKVSDVLGINNPVINMIGFTGFNFIYAKGSTDISIQGVINDNKEVLLDLNLSQGIENLTTKLTTLGKNTTIDIGDIITSLKSIPVVNVIGFDELIVNKEYLEVGIDIEGHEVKIVENFSKGFAVLDFGEISASTFIPPAKGTVIDDLVLDNSLIIISAKDKNITIDDFPGDMKSQLVNINFPLNLKSGITLFSDLDKTKMGKLGKALTNLGITQKQFPLTGVFPSKIFKLFSKASSSKQAKHAATLSKTAIKEILKSISLAIDIPVPKIPGVDKFITFDDALISIGGDMGEKSLWNQVPESMTMFKPTGDIDISLQGGINMHIKDFNEDMKALIDLNIGEGDASISLLAVAEGEWTNPFGIKSTVLKDSGFDISFKTTNGSSEIDLSLFATATVHKKDNLGVSANFIEDGGIPKLKYLEIDGPISLKELDGDIPGGGLFTLNKLLITSTGIEAKVESTAEGLDLNTNFYLFEMSTTTGDALIAAIDLTLDGNFSIGTLAKVAGLNDPLGIIQNNLDAMVVANAGLLLSTKPIKPVSVADLKSGVAKDFFTDIFGKSTVPINIDSITFLSDFKADMMGEIGTALTGGGIKLGLTEEVIINGTIGGLFDSDPLNLDLEFLIAETLTLDQLKTNGLNLPSCLAGKPPSSGAVGEKMGIFLKVIDETVEAGLLLGFDVTLKNTTFDFTGTLGVQLSEEEIGLSITGAMTDNWKNAFGIDGFELKNTVITAEVGEANIKFGMGGETVIAGRDILVAADVIIGVIDIGVVVPVPEGLGFKTKINKLDSITYEILDPVLVPALATVGTVAAVNAAVVSSGVLIPAVVVGAPVILATTVGFGFFEYYLALKAEKHNALKTLRTYQNNPDNLSEEQFEIQKKNLKDQAEELKNRYEKFADTQAWIFGGKNIYFSFATPGASDVNLQIPDGVHLSGDFELFGGLIKTPTLSPSVGWIIKISNEISTIAKDVKKEVKKQTILYIKRQIQLNKS